MLRADVCWNGTTAYLKGAGSCPSGQWPYYVENGEVVNAVTNQVQAYVPLDDACDMGFCDVKPPEAGPGDEGAMCCGTSGCSDLAAGSSCSGSTVTVWCMDGEEAVNQNGTWICYEPEN